MDTIVTILINAVLVLAFLTVLAVVSIALARFLSGTLADYRPH